MHAKVDGLYHFVDGLKRRHSEVPKYADARFLAEDIRKVDELYLVVRQAEGKSRPASVRAD